MMAPPAPDTRKTGGHGSGPRGSAKKRQKAPEQREREERFDPKQSVNRVMASLSKSTTRHHYERRSSGTEEEEVKRELKVSDFITVSELAGLLGVSSAKVVAKCMELGMMVTITTASTLIRSTVASELATMQTVDEYEDI